MIKIEDDKELGMGVINIFCTFLSGKTILFCLLIIPANRQFLILTKG
jgi:hypothetical protein